MCVGSRRSRKVDKDKQRKQGYAKKQKKEGTTKWSRKRKKPSGRAKHHIIKPQGDQNLSSAQSSLSFQEGGIIFCKEEN